MLKSRHPSQSTQLPAYTEVPTRRESRSAIPSKWRRFLLDPRNVVYPLILLGLLYLAAERHRARQSESGSGTRTQSVEQLDLGEHQHLQSPFLHGGRVRPIEVTTTLIVTSTVQATATVTTTAQILVPPTSSPALPMEYTNRAIAPYTSPQEAKPAARIIHDRTIIGDVDEGWTLIADWKLSDGRQLEDQRTCLTYQERFAGYDVPLAADTPMPPTIGASTAFLMRVRPEWVHKNTINDVHIPIYRSLITELQAIGIDVYFLVHLRQEWNMAGWMDEVHPEFKGRVYAFVFEEFTSHFLPGTFRDPVYDNHVSLSSFMNSTVGRQYEFAWWMEDDIRTTSSWSNLFNYLNATVPEFEPKPLEWELRNDRTHLPESKLGRYQPDLFLTWLHDGSPKAEEMTVGDGNRCSDFVKPNELAKAFIMFTGYSRRMHDAMMSYYASGHSCFCETFVPTIAKRNRLNIHLAQLPQYMNPAVHDVVPTWGHWHPNAATPFYETWQKNATLCRPGPALLHKVWEGWTP